MDRVGRPPGGPGDPSPTDSHSHLPLVGLGAADRSGYRNAMREVIDDIREFPESSGQSSHRDVGIPPSQPGSTLSMAQVASTSQKKEHASSSCRHPSSNLDNGWLNAWRRWKSTR